MSRSTGRDDASEGLPPGVAVFSETGSRGASEDVVRVVRPVPGELLCLVADGLGGHEAGRTAASIAVDAVVREVGHRPLDRARLTATVEAANAAIVEAQEASPARAGMRTTLVLLHLDARSAFWLHCGDSRLYHVRGGDVAARTVDHSLAQMQSGADGGDATAASVSRHALMRSLGSRTAGESRPRLVHEPLPLLDGDRFLLCSDGFWERMDPERLAAPAASADAWLDALGASLGSVEGERDDASAIAVRHPWTDA